MTCQPGAVRAGAFHPHPRQVPNSRATNTTRHIRPVSSRTTRHPTHHRSRRPPPQHAHPDACPLHPSSGACSLRWSSPSLLSQTVQGVARTSREGDRDEHAARTANSITLRNGACPIPNTRQRSTLVRPERTGHHQHDSGPAHPHWQICARSGWSAESVLRAIQQASRVVDTGVHRTRRRRRVFWRRRRALQEARTSDATSYPRLGSGLGGCGPAERGDSVARSRRWSSSHDADDTHSVRTKRVRCSEHVD